MGKSVYDYIKKSITDIFNMYEVDFAKAITKAGIKQELKDKKINQTEYIKLRVFITSEYIRKVVIDDEY